MFSPKCSLIVFFKNLSFFLALIIFSLLFWLPCFCFRDYLFVVLSDYPLIAISFYTCSLSSDNLSSASRLLVNCFRIFVFCLPADSIVLFPELLGIGWVSRGLHQRNTTSRICTRAITERKIRTRDVVQRRRWAAFVVVEKKSKMRRRGKRRRRRRGWRRRRQQQQ